MNVHRLPDNVINQIAAGEVVERPASVVKELVENALDAGADRIEIVSEAGGRNLIRVTDNGSGMSSEDLRLAIERHCTSKLADDLLNIGTLGFRGEALASIASVSRLAVSTRRAIDTENGWCLEVAYGRTGEVKPAALSPGTSIEVVDLFANLPARLKFLKTERAETAAISETVRRTAFAFPQTRFVYDADGRNRHDLAPTDLAGRVAQIMGSEFMENALPMEAERDRVRLAGFAGLPVYHRGNAQWQYLFVNGRPVRDRQLAGALRGAYADVMARDRHPVAVLFLDLPPDQVDVNVHPAKAEVRFCDPGHVRGLLVGAIRQAINETRLRGSTERTGELASAFRREPPRISSAPSAAHDWRQSPYAPLDRQRSGLEEAPQTAFEYDRPTARAVDEEPERADHPLGAARAQLHENYIVAQTRDGLVIVDQHAAHERIVYEALKKNLEQGTAGQMLLVPQIVEMEPDEIAVLLENADEFRRYGLAFESFGPGALAVRETPAVLGEVDCAGLLRDLADEIAEGGRGKGLRDRLDRVASAMACHGSVRSGRRLRPAEMDALLRQMEATPNAGQCNHGRPTFIELSLRDIERLFGR